MAISTTHKYAIAQIFVCGNIDKEEFKDMNEFLGQVQNQTLNHLERQGLLAETLFRENEE